MQKHDERLTGIINDPERKRKYLEWQQWPEHRMRVADYEATLPDAPVETLILWLIVEITHLRVRLTPRHQISNLGMML